MGSKPAAGTPLPMGKRLAFIVLALVLGIVVVEALAWIGYGVIRRQTFPRDSYRETAARIAAPADNDEPTGQQGMGLLLNTRLETIHPYLGYVMDPDADPKISDQGFPVLTSLVDEPSDDTLVVGVLGGSFAAGFSWVAPDRLEAAFEDFGREVVVVNLAMGGYKQPQQLMTLVWALSLGAHFDVVLNLDGFNDIVLPAVNNLPDGVHPFFPRRWNQRVSSFSSPEETVLLAAIAETDARRSRLAASYSRWRGDRSVLVSLLWRSRDRMLERTAGEYARRLDAARPTGDARFLTHGPPFRADPETDVYDRLAGYWRSCSEQLDRLCQANGITYYHLLQPNQYVDGSKPLTEKELATAFTEDHFYRNAVRMGYPWLSRHGAELRRAGVRFADLTMVFAETRKTVYVDDCCHVNHRGYAIIARELRRMIRADQRERDR